MKKKKGIALSKKDLTTIVKEVSKEMRKAATSNIPKANGPEVELADTSVAMEHNLGFRNMVRSPAEDQHVKRMQQHWIRMVGLHTYGKLLAAFSEYDGEFFLFRNEEERIGMRSSVCEQLVAMFSVHVPSVDSRVNPFPGLNETEVYHCMTAWYNELVNTRHLNREGRDTSSVGKIVAFHMTSMHEFFGDKVEFTPSSVMGLAKALLKQESKDIMAIGSFLSFETVLESLCPPQVSMDFLYLLILLWMLSSHSEALILRSTKHGYKIMS